MSSYYPWGVYWGSAPTYTHTYTRDDLIRAILGQQWAVAITLLAIATEIDGGNMHSIAPRLLSRLPCAVDVVTEMERS